MPPRPQTQSKANPKPAMPKKKFKTATMLNALGKQLQDFFMRGLNWLASMVQTFLGIKPQNHMPVNTPAPAKVNPEPAPAAATDPAPTPTAENHEHEPSLFEQGFDLAEELARPAAFCYAFYMACTNQQFAASAAGYLWQNMFAQNSPDQDDDFGYDAAGQRRARTPRPGRTHAASADSVD